MAHDFPTSRLLVTLGWAKSGEEAARQFTAGQDGARERRLLQQLRRAARGLRLVNRELRAVAERDEVLSREHVELLGILIKVSDAIVRPLTTMALASETGHELQGLEEAIAELDDLVENQVLAAEIPAIYEDVAARIADLCDSDVKPAE